MVATKGISLSLDDTTRFSPSFHCSLGLCVEELQAYIAGPSLPQPAVGRNSLYMNRLQKIVLTTARCWAQGAANERNLR